MDSRGNHYATTSLWPLRIVALNPSGSVRYERTLDLPSGTSPETTKVTPDEGHLLMNDIFHRLLALRSKNGAKDWRIELEPVEEGRAQYWLRRQPI